MQWKNSDGDIFLNDTQLLMEGETYIPHTYCQRQVYYNLTTVVAIVATVDGAAI